MALRRWVEASTTYLDSGLALDLMISEGNKQKGRVISYPALVLAKLNINLLFSIPPKL